MSSDSKLIEIKALSLITEGNIETVVKEIDKSEENLIRAKEELENLAVALGTLLDAQEQLLAEIARLKYLAGINEVAEWQ